MIYLGGAVCPPRLIKIKIKKSLNLVTRFGPRSGPLAAVAPRCRAVGPQLPAMLCFGEPQALSHHPVGNTSTPSSSCESHEPATVEQGPSTTPRLHDRIRSHWICASRTKIVVRGARSARSGSSNTRFGVWGSGAPSRGGERGFVGCGGGPPGSGAQRWRSGTVAEEGHHRGGGAETRHRSRRRAAGIRHLDTLRGEEGRRDTPPVVKEGPSGIHRWDPLHGGGRLLSRRRCAVMEEVQRERGEEGRESGGRHRIWEAQGERERERE